MVRPTVKHNQGLSRANLFAGAEDLFRRAEMARARGRSMSLQDIMEEFAHQVMTDMPDVGLLVEFSASGWVGDGLAPRLMGQGGRCAGTARAARYAGKVAAR